MRGGARKGAGRPLGVLSSRTQEIAARASENGETPLDYMLRIMRDPTQDNARRDDMAKAASSFIHPRLSSVESKNETVVRYVARIPEKAADPVTWQEQHSPTQTIQ